VILLVDAQTIGVLVTATSVTVAAIYYIFTLRINRNTQELALKAQQQNLETRRIGLVDSIITRTFDEGMMRNFFELLRYEWSDYGDFERKYGSENNIDGAAKRFGMWHSLNAVGGMLRNGVLTAEDCYDAGIHLYPIYTWAKYKPILEENRRRYNGKDYLKNLEFFSDEMLRVVKEKDPTYVFPETLDKYVPDK